MIIKTERFEKILNEKVGILSLNKKYPLKPVGSYPLKPLGSYINDIDYTEFVYFNQRMVELLQKIIKDVEKSPDFVFMYINCGRYPEFDLPWTFDNFGGCDFEYLKALQWYESFRDKGLVSKEDLDVIESKLLPDTIYLKDIIEIESLFDGFRKIVWTKEDILAGHKIIRGQRYDLLEQILIEGKVVCKYIYKYTDEKGKTGYVNVEVGLEEKGVKRRFKNPAFNYYLDEWYSILKSLRWNIKKEFFEEYLKKIREIEVYLSLRSQIELTKKIIKYKLLPPGDVKNMMEDSKKFLDSLGLDYKGKKGNEIEDLLTEKINTFSKNLVDEYRYKLKDEALQKFNIYLDRADASKKPVKMEDLFIKRGKGILCPFFDVDINEYIFLYNLAQRLLYSPNYFIDCIVETANKLNISVPVMIVEHLPQNQLYLQEDENFIYLYDGENKLSTNCKYRLDDLRSEILVGEKIE
jgi:hypothetical protein